ncbi:MAG: hypothetical protein SGBAC_006895 [Bacillariaceae sp.]
MTVTEDKITWRESFRRHYEYFAGAGFDIPFALLALIGELLLGFLVILKVRYTEIDWIAYMQEVQFWLDGEYDYMKIRGATGPLVYPAGFLYLFGALKWLTNGGVLKAQIVFLFFYLATQAALFALYTITLRNRPRKRTSNQVWSFRIAMGCLCLSKRFHSIFLLRLFNDGPTMLMTYISFLCFLTKRWNIGCLFFSFAVSLKMNVLLFAPGLLYLLIQESPKWTIPRLAICGISQVLIGAPFLLRHPVSYLRKAFELDRKFFHIWTVNLKFLPEDVFLSKTTAVILLLLHVGLLVAYVYRLTKASRPVNAETMLSTLFVSNFIGICCARTLHYQFYSWYFSSMPFLLWRETPYPLPIRLAFLAAMEYAFLTFPATAESSGILQVVHWLILIPCVLVMTPTETNKPKTE